jgi:hypothetical protein
MFSRHSTNASWLAGLTILLFASVAPAQLPPAISINLVGTEGNAATDQGRTLAPADIAGVVPLPNWNNVNAPVGGATGMGTNLINAAGTATTTSVTITGSPNSWTIPAANLPNTPDGVMMSGYADTSDTSITSVAVAGVPFTVPYDVIVYAIGDSQQNRAGDYTIGTQSFRLLDNVPFTGTFTQSTAPGGSGPGGAGNYVRFTNLSGPTFTLTAQAAQDIAGFRAPINAIQIIPVPEPGHVLLACAAAFSGLAAWRRRRNTIPNGQSG